MADSVKRIIRTLDGFIIRNGHRTQRCFEYCPMCKKQCGSCRDHLDVHQCDQHWWIRLSLPFNQFTVVSGSIAYEAQAQAKSAVQSVSSTAKKGARA